MAPVSWEASDPTYLGENNSLLAENKRRLCPERWYADDVESGEQQLAAFLLDPKSFTNQSLHSSLQLGRCFFLYSWDNTPCTINSRYGLDRLKESERLEDG
ncbi:hypothetical protein ACRE_086920 [Hapsidospora chrysogenum ATCC 11550]|uniref:Uncharacterized protein n=1 Tax=Hapsidospora chrysogenum (strain ATCC 11550 / CBS 779.69 / DSM 880 / IAM 14645 / JCM 23072 / IMI 49137) TaxID=857340 RepID=A0A086SU32_HAPC1|nr:hypothetical protein ACRE_086920 [Hapsidospora chrysogenum ATCC 11550]